MFLMDVCMVGAARLNTPRLVDNHIYIDTVIADALDLYYPG